jgi:hypothetical protein
MNGIERFFILLTIVGLAGLFGILTWAGLIWFGAIAASAGPFALAHETQLGNRNRVEHGDTHRLFRPAGSAMRPSS